jgi:hypothetical protein
MVTKNKKREERKMKKTKLNKGLLEELVTTILNTRDFCGDEVEAMKQVCYDYGMKKLSEATIEAVMEIADKRWNESLRNFDSAKISYGAFDTQLR